MKANRKNVTDLCVTIICLVRLAYESPYKKAFYYLLRDASLCAGLLVNLIEQLEKEGLED